MESEDSKTESLATDKDEAVMDPSTETAELNTEADVTDRPDPKET